jgi:hypothetical protein
MESACWLPFITIKTQDFNENYFLKEEKMKHLISLIAAGFMALGLINCSSGDDNTFIPAPTQQMLTGSPERIDLSEVGSMTVSWTQEYNDIFTNESTNGNCVRGLRVDADNNPGAQAAAELVALLNASVILPGTGTNTNVNGLPAINIDFADASSQTYYLVAQTDVSAEFQVLSNADAILNFYEEMMNRLSDNNEYYDYCPGKTDK